jgi:glycosyltransferase involved in cell wall biosynthesis
MDLGLREKVSFPEVYNGFRLTRTHGRVFAIPLSLDSYHILYRGLFFHHPAVLSATNLEELQERIDSSTEQFQAVVIGECDGHDLFRLRGTLYAVPQSARHVDLYMAADRRRAGVLSAGSVEEIQARIRQKRAGVPVEFAGWLPIFEFSGNCGTHPQFDHTSEWPSGYHFNSSAPPKPRGRPPWFPRVNRFFKKLGEALAGTCVLIWSLSALIRPQHGVTLRARLRIFLAFLRLAARFLCRGCRPDAVLRFLHTRDMPSQLLLGDHEGLVFLTSMPYTYGQNPWVLEIEDPTTLFYPHIQNGHNCDLRIRRTPWYHIVKALLEADHCKAILTHMKSTAALLPTLFGSEVIRNKVVYAPLGVGLPSRWQRHDPQPADEPIHLLFINSWCQATDNFYMRGGMDVLEAFAVLHERYPQLRLTMRTNLPPLDHRYHRIMEAGWVRIIDRFQSPEEMADLHAHSHIFVLPAARVHIVSLLQAMSYGLAVVTSDGWGFEEYVTHERNGLIVTGRYGKTSWADTEAGFVRENYQAMHTPASEVIAGLVEAVSRLVEDRTLRARLGRTARADVEAKYGVAQWNRALQETFDRARAVQSVLPQPADVAAAEAAAQEVVVH